MCVQYQHLEVKGQNPGLSVSLSIIAAPSEVPLLKCGHQCGSMQTPPLRPPRAHGTHLLKCHVWDPPEQVSDPLLFQQKPRPMGSERLTQAFSANTGQASPLYAPALGWASGALGAPPDSFRSSVFRGVFPGGGRTHWSLYLGGCMFEYKKLERRGDGETLGNSS